MPVPADADQFAGFINALMDNQGLSGAQLARRLAVAQSQVSRWRRGEGGISLDNLLRINEVFGTDLNYLKRLAGFPASSLSIAQDDAGEAFDALWDAERAEMKAALRGIPAQFHRTVLEATRSARRMAIDNVRAAISLLPGGELAPPTREPGQDDAGGNRPSGTPLARLFASAGAY